MAFMRHNNNGRRHNHNNRHRSNHSQPGGHNPQNGQNGQRRYVNRVNQVFDSNGPDGRIRGTAQQIVEKFTSLARDASVSGDKVLMQNYYQHAEHYQRLHNEIMEEAAVFEREREAQRQAHAASMATQPGQGDFAKADTDPSDGFAAAVSERAPAVAVPAPIGITEDAAALPAFVQVPITTSAPSAENPARSGLRGRGPRRNADSTPDDNGA
jgi:hypothetical protein